MEGRGHRAKAFYIAALSIGLFYWIVTRPAMQHSILHEYTTEHATEYAIVCLFFWANCDLVFCALRNRKELAAVRYGWLPKRKGIEPVENADAIHYFVLAGPKHLHDSMTFRRLMQAISYIRERGTAVGFREYLKDLESRDADETYSRYSFPRFATGILPILGLLGTVVHFGGALSGLNSDDLTSKVPEIVSGMGTAFNTTCAALTASTSTMLIRYLIETQEEGVLLNLNRYVDEELLHRFVAEEQAEESTNLDMAVAKLAAMLESKLSGRNAA